MRLKIKKKLSAHRNWSDCKSTILCSFF